MKTRLISPFTVCGLNLLTATAMAQSGPGGMGGGPPADFGRVEITSERDNETRERRESMVSKIVIGREEIERQGDSTVDEILKRQPGISIDGPPGRGGGLRMRGLSQGYTQILFDGQRMPPGFSIQSLTPEMVERIEIYRAPTAATGAQAIAGTINIITREGRRGMPSELKMSTSFQGGYQGGMASMVRHQDTENMTGNYTLSVNRWAMPDHSTTELSHTDTTNGANNFVRDRVADSHSVREGVNGTARLQFKGAPGESLTLMPFMAVSHAVTLGTVNLNQDNNGSLSSGTGSTYNDAHNGMARLNGQWQRKLSADSRMEWRFNVGGFESHSQFRQDALGSLISGLNEDTQVHDRSAMLSGKYVDVLGGGHEWVSGVETERVRREQVILSSYGPSSGDYAASSLRYALYSQDEWQLTPNWGTHLGARYEGLMTQGNTSSGDVSNRNSVFTPLLHALYRPDPDSRDQIRFSLTRSFKVPNMQSLLARRTYVRDSNGPTNPDTMGNPNLRPEIATGIDIAIERYLSQGGVVSASVFHRHVQDLIRNVVSFDGSRWVSSPQNISEAVTDGVELEGKFRLEQLIDAAPAIEMRSNVSFFRSRVLSVMGPDNRLDQQPSMTANLGADYRLRSLPLTIGGNINYNPGYNTRTSDMQLLTISQKRVMDFYGLWRFDPNTALRVSFSNLMPHDYTTGNLYNGNGIIEDSTTRNRSWTNVMMALEMKL